MERDRRATGEHTANQYLIRRRDRQLIAAVYNKCRAAPGGLYCKYHFNIAQHGLEACQRVPDRDREHGRTVGVIEQICVAFLFSITPPQPPPRAIKVVDSRRRRGGDISEYGNDALAVGPSDRQLSASSDEGARA